MVVLLNQINNKELIFIIFTIKILKLYRIRSVRDNYDMQTMYFI